MKNNYLTENHQLIYLTQKLQIASCDVMFLEADINYTIFNLSSGKQLIASSTLKHFEKIVPQNQFLRINKSTMLNKAFVKNIRQNKITLKNERVITVSRRRMPFVLENI